MIFASSKTLMMNLLPSKIITKEKSTKTTTCYLVNIAWFFKLEDRNVEHVSFSFLWLELFHNNECMISGSASKLVRITSESRCEKLYLDSLISLEKPPS